MGADPRRNFYDGPGRRLTAEDWDRIAYCARYGNQPLSEIMTMRPADLNGFNAALSRIIRAENGKPDGGAT